MSDVPANFMAVQQRGIAGIRMPVTRIEGRRRISQNWNEANRAGVEAGRAARGRPSGRKFAAMTPA